MFRPSPERPFLSEFPELQLLRQDGSFVPASEAFKGKQYVLVYFSAHWCPPCQRFTPILADFYNDHHDRHKFEVLFVSSDRKESRMLDYFQNRASNYVVRNKRQVGQASSPAPAAAAAAAATVGDKGGAPRPRGLDRTPIASGMADWLAVPFLQTKVAQALTRRFGVRAIPKLVVVEVDTGRVITTEGKTMVYRDELAVSFPWLFADEALGRRRKGGYLSGWLTWFLVFCLVAALLLRWWSHSSFLR